MEHKLWVWMTEVPISVQWGLGMKSPWCWQTLLTLHRFWHHIGFWRIIEESKLNGVLVWLEAAWPRWSNIKYVTGGNGWNFNPVSASCSKLLSRWQTSDKIVRFYRTTKNRWIFVCHTTDFITQFYRPILSAINLAVELGSDFAEKIGR